MTDPPSEVNAILTFADGDGRRWMAGAHLGPLVSEADNDDHVPVSTMIDRPWTLVDFRIVRQP